MEEKVRCPWCCDNGINQKYHDVFSGGENNKENILEKGKKYEVDNIVYKVLDSKAGGSVEFVSVKKKVSNVVIKDTVVINGIKCKVTAVSKNAFKDNKKLKSVKIGKNVESIGKKAFYNCKKLSVVTVNTTKLTEKSVGANAFGKLMEGIKLKVPSSKLKAYKKLFYKKGISKKAKIVQIKK